MTDPELLEYFRTAKDWNGFSTHRRCHVRRLVHIAERALICKAIIEDKDCLADCGGCPAHCALEDTLEVKYD